jgi:hypothetical protein
LLGLGLGVDFINTSFAYHSYITGVHLIAAALVADNTNVSLKLDFASRKKGGMAVSAVWRLINVLAFIEPKQRDEAHRRDACAPLPKSKSKLLLV